MKKMSEATKKKLWIGLAVMALLGVTGTAIVIANQNQSDSEPEAAIEQKVENKNKATKKSEENKSDLRKTTDSDRVVSRTYDQFGVQSNRSTQSSTSASLTPKEMTTVANVIRQQQKEKEQSKNQGVIPTPIPVVPIPEKPVTPPVTPPIETSKPVINYQEGIVVVKGSAFNPYQYFEVLDSLDPAVSVYVDTTAIDTSVIGPQSFIVVATNKFGNSTVEKIPIYIASQPVLTASTETIHVPIGTEFQPLQYVQSTDEIDGNLTDNIVVSNSTVDMEQEGVYSVRYVVQNSYGIMASLALQVMVVNEAPTIYAPPVTTEINQVFNPLEGVTAVAYNGEVIQVTEANIVANTVDIHTEGTYFVTYQISDRFGKESELVKRTVIVENESPVLHGVKDLAFPVGTQVTEELLLEGISATDREDDKQGLPLTVTLDQAEFLAIDSTKPGTFPLTYIVVDSMGKETKQQITVTILGEKPVIHGIEDTQIELNQVFDPLAGISVTDQGDGTIPTSNVVVTGSIDSSKEGVYTLKYQVKNSLNQSSEVYTRIITVKADESNRSLLGVMNTVVAPLPSDVVGEHPQLVENPLEELAVVVPIVSEESEIAVSETIVHKEIEE
ncbi:DUF5011 domain-containing protein [Enterococcus ureasiticus]|uniref:immunoglobulin-like domain-containing protein n=1 Tax=Enterococcus ureasiticus TaxID=903984 RepID=UPI001A8C3FC1|nr:immunoglobulin-like domain-containing protein [Enterococcus ureasiticus]MBO0474878.1 DUF5011 domain-containing protein [Enterococcus ureasiticus]